MEKYRGKFKKYLNDLAKAKPAPGGGSAAALVFSIGLSLIEKAINFSSPTKFKKELKKLQALNKKLYPIIDQDGVIFAKIISCKGEKRLQFICKSENLIISLGQGSIKVFSLAKEIESGIKKSIISDFRLGLECAKIALLSCVLNLEANQKMFGRKNKFIGLFKKALNKWH